MRRITEAKVMAAQTLGSWSEDRHSLTKKQVASLIRPYLKREKRGEFTVFEQRLIKLYEHFVLQLPEPHGEGGKRKKASPKISTVVSNDLKRMQRAFEEFITVCESLDEATKDFITDQMIQKSSRSSQVDAPSFSDCLNKVYNSFLPVSKASNIDIEVKRGQAPVAVREAITALADLYRDLTGNDPIRTYEGVKIDGRRGKGDTGHFHEFVQDFISFVPEEYGLSKKSLAGHIRKVCDSYRQSG